MAFTGDGIKNLKELIQMHKDDPSILERQQKALDHFKPPSNESSTDS
jgi:hypothetical protein